MTDAPPLINPPKSWGMSAAAQPKAKHFFTAENVSHSLMSPDTPEDQERINAARLASVLQPFTEQAAQNNNTVGSNIDLQPPPLLQSMPPPLQARTSHDLQLSSGITNLNSSIGGVSSSASTNPASPLSMTGQSMQGLTEDESDEIRRKMVTAHLVQMHVARNNMAARFAAQQLQSSYQQVSTMREDDLDINRVDPELYKVKMCRNMNRTGVCGYGYLCVFAHQLSDLRSRETNIDVLKRLYADGKPNVNPLKYKVRSCQKFIEQGSCPYEPHCVFAHGPAELRTMEQNMQAVQRVQQICQATGTNYTQRLQQQEQQQQMQQQQQDMLVSEPPPLTPFC